MRYIVYIAGAISSPDAATLLQNIHRFSVVENAMIRDGFAPINPASDATSVGLGGVTYEMVLERDRALIERCDAVYFMKGWKDSPGAKSEHRWAVRNNVLCVEEPEDGFESAGFDNIRQAMYDKQADFENKMVHFDWRPDGYQNGKW